MVFESTIVKGAEFGIENPSENPSRNGCPILHDIGKKKLRRGRRDQCFIQGSPQRHTSLIESPQIGPRLVAFCIPNWCLVSDRLFFATVSGFAFTASYQHPRLQRESRMLLRSREGKSRQSVNHYTSSQGCSIRWQMHLQPWPWRRIVWTATSHTPTLTVTRSVRKFFVCHVMMSHATIVATCMSLQFEPHDTKTQGLFNYCLQV